MSVNIPTLPEAVYAAYLTAVKDLADRQVSNRSGLINARIRALPVFSMTLADIKAGQFPSAEGAWLVAPTGDTENKPFIDPALVEVATASREFPQPVLARFTQSAGAGEFFLRMVQVLNSHSSANDAFQLRFLRIPGMGVTAFWLSTAGGKKDLIVPLRGPSVLTPGEPISSDKLLLALLPLVQKFEAFNGEKA